MAKIVAKGTVLQQEIASVFTPVAQIIGTDHQGAESETYESDTLDNTNAGIPYDPTGRTEGGSMDFELFYDPALAGHQAITDLVTTPAKCNWKQIFADAANTELPFTSAGVGVGISVALAEGVKMPVSLRS